jgi:hypothetical protein
LDGVERWRGVGGEPVDDVQAGDDGEILDVVRHQGQAVDQSGRADEQIEFRGRLADVAEAGLEFAVFASDRESGESELARTFGRGTMRGPETGDPVWARMTRADGSGS